ncbi:MAG: ferrous iron transporter B, partial [Clostridiales bacterium]
GLNQHTGNWPGKTVANAQGYCSTDNHSYVMVDIPGTYSLMAHSTEEEVARNFICFGAPDAVIVVCDATCLERNLNLVLQTIEISPKVIVCVNLLDEADRKKIHIDLPALSQKLGVPVVGTVACKNNSLQHLLAAVDELMHCPPLSPLQPPYCQPIEEAISLLEPLIKEKTNGKINPRWLSLKLLDYDQSLIDELTACLGQDMLADPTLAAALNQAHTLLAKQNITKDNLPEQIVSALLATAETVCRDTVSFANNDYDEQDRRIDKILTNKWSGYPIMLGLLAIVFWLTITGANYPSQLLSHGFFWLEDRLSDLFHYVGAPPWLHGIVILGAYRVLAWVVSVMLPPMAIFFPLFTLLEDAGYLPRVAYNLDKSFKRCHACGKQALTMCMGFGCNAAGVIGCRIIDSPRERLIAMLTNNFVPCNGR